MYLIKMISAEILQFENIAIIDVSHLKNINSFNERLECLERISQIISQDVQ